MTEPPPSLKPVIVNALAGFFISITLVAIPFAVVMDFEPQPLEESLRVEMLKRGLKDLPKDELVAYTEKLVDVTARLTHNTKQLLKKVIELESNSEGKNTI